jgi:hypothetical protein
MTLKLKTPDEGQIPLKVVEKVGEYTPGFVFSILSGAASAYSKTKEATPFGKVFLFVHISHLGI